ncbi:MAG TPA: hypothetical protein VKU85_14950 [bacterium]|nr:hypothetical protein [bacterium]
MLNLSARSIGAVLGVLACLLVSVSPADAQCVTRGGGCQATTTITSYNGPPVVACPVWGTLYTVTVSVKCGPFGPPVVESEIVCSETATPVVVQAGGSTHYIAPDSGANWGDVLSDCGNLIHKVE